jgi:hypothetical protein
MSIVWVKTNETRNGSTVRQSYTAAVADGLMCREVILIDEGRTNTFSPANSPDPGSSRMRMAAEAMCFVPTANGAPTVWVQESVITDGERTDTLYSNALATSKTLYLSITTTQEAPKKFPSGSSAGNQKSVMASMAMMA